MPAARAPGIDSEGQKQLPSAVHGAGGANGELLAAGRERDRRRESRRGDSRERERKARFKDPYGDAGRGWSGGDTVAGSKATLKSVVSLPNHGQDESVQTEESLRQAALLALSSPQAHEDKMQ